MVLIIEWPHTHTHIHGGIKLVDTTATRVNFGCVGVGRYSFFIQMRMLS